MAAKVNRRTVDLSAYPDLVVIYLGMRVNRLAGLKTLFGFGPKIASSVAARPDGLLLHESYLFSLFPPHTGMRQYWRDFDSLATIWSKPRASSRSRRFSQRAAGCFPRASARRSPAPPPFPRRFARTSCSP
jgi:hypothetical protein